MSASESNLPPPMTETLEDGRDGPPRLVLRVIAGPDVGKELALSPGTHRVGTDPSSELRLTDGSVSRTHLIIEVLPDAVKLLDHDSRNGSFCEGLRFERVEATAGSRVRLGRTELQLLAAPRLNREAASAGGLVRFGGLVGVSPALRALCAELEKLAALDADVLLLGETGAGKEVCARALHAHSPRASRPLVVCDLAAASPTLFESELFGHVRGAFTGAHADRAGAFERADGGTLFLDEVGEVPLELQPRLLRALENREIKRVGADAYRQVDARVIAATHRDLAAEVRAGRFRADLFHRIDVHRVRLPPLRERRQDISLLADALLRERGYRPEALSPQTRIQLQAYDWPGNVRELRNVVERAVSLGAVPELAELPAAPRAGAATQTPVSFKQAKEQLVHAFERDYLRDLLERCGRNVSEAARQAGIDRVTLHRLLKKHGLGGGAG